MVCENTLLQFPRDIFNFPQTKQRNVVQEYLQILLFTAALTYDCYTVNMVHTKQNEPHCSAHGCDKICEINFLAHKEGS
jgi:hypothetical protein